MTTKSFSERNGLKGKVPSEVYCPTCDVARVWPDLIWVARDIPAGLDEFIGCRVCNCKTHDAMPGGNQ